MRTARDLITTDNNIIDITPLIETLRRQQYINTLHELHQELTVLAQLPNLDKHIKEKMTRSLKGVSQLLDNIKSKTSF